MKATRAAGMQGASALWRCGRRSWPPAPWPWTRWICAAGPSTSGGPRDMWSRLRWDSVSSASVSLLEYGLSRGSAVIWALPSAPEIHWPWRWRAHAQAELAAGMFLCTLFSAN